MRLLLILFPAAVLMACTSGSPADGDHDVPAKVEHPTTEAELATLRLSPGAVGRLGIESVAATEELLSGTRTLGGEIMVPEGRRVVVTAPVAGTLMAAGAAKAGARVARGDEVFRLVPLVPAERDQRIEAERAVAAAEAEELAARQRLERLKELIDDGAASARSVEEASAQHDVAAAALTAARERLNILRLNPIGSGGEITVKAPFAGVIQAISAASGQTVSASTPLFEVAQVSTFWIRVPVYAGEANEIDPAAPAAVSALDAVGAPRFAERIEAPLRGDPLSATVDLFYELPAEGEPMRPGERVSVQLVLNAEEGGLTIPYSAIVYDIHGTTWVYEDLGDGVYSRRRIEVARHVADRVVVSRGLLVGTRVVSVGAAELFGTEFGAGK
jgi:RND family efflux transporter MFP subunit